MQRPSPRSSAALSFSSRLLSVLIPVYVYGVFQVTLMIANYQLWTGRWGLDKHISQPPPSHLCRTFADTTVELCLRRYITLTGTEKAACGLYACLPIGFCLNTCWRACSSWLSLLSLIPLEDKHRMINTTLSAQCYYSYGLYFLCFPTWDLLNKLNIGYLSNWGP